jgi:hypothetical protein
MGTNFSFELGSLAWNECSGRAMENLTANGSSGVIFSAFFLHLLFPRSKVEWVQISRSN